jgi:pilus assembly protein FimV
LSKALPRVRMKVLACLLMAWPLFANAQPPAVQNQAVAGTAAPIRTIPDEAFQQWIKEDNKLIDGILLSLTHIDSLVTEIERMLRQLPDFGVPPVAAKPAPAPAPVVIEKTVIKEVEVPGPLGGWMPTLAGAGLLALLAFWLGRKQGTTQPAAAAEATFAEPEPKPAKPVLEKRAAVPAAAPPISVVKPAESAPPPKLEAVPEPSVQKEPEPAPASLEPISSIDLPSSGQGDQALELAEIMLSMGLGHGATQTLTEQIRNEPKQALRHWLKLLDIYRKNGQQEEFERSAEELRLHFNVRPEDWHAQPGSSQSLESFPHIAKRLTELWGKPDCLVYMQNLLDDNRGGARSGFPQSVAEELLMLTTVMREAYGFLPG